MNRAISGSAANSALRKSESPAGSRTCVYIASPS
jgi:hypothetical protein